MPQPHRSLSGSSARLMRNVLLVTIATLVTAWLPLAARAQGTSTPLQLANGGKIVPNVSVLALTNAGKVPVGTTGSDGFARSPRRCRCGPSRHTHDHLPKL